MSSQQLHPSPTKPIKKPVTVNGRYIIHEKIGEGGMGVVYRASDRLSEHTLAFKQVIVPTWHYEVDSDTEGEIEEALRLALAHEFETLASLRHPNIISVLDYGFDQEKRPYFTMDYLLEAKTILEVGAQLDEPGKVNLIQQLLQALAYLHRRGILHRDLKPANVLVAHRTVRVLDFGLATTQKTARQAAGSIPYIAPEVWEDQPHTEAADLYAVGIMAFELFAGRHPFDINSHRFIDQVLDDPPNLALLDASPTVTAVIGRLIDKTQLMRYASAEACIKAFSLAIGRTIPTESIAIRESYLQAAIFVGRAAEKRQLLQAMAQAKAGHGSGWLINGESGVGKSRLIEEIRVQALVQGALVVRGQGVEDVGNSPLQLWRDVLRRLILTAPLDDLDLSVLQTYIPDIGQLLQRKVQPAPELEATAARQRLISTITNLFSQQTQWILLVLEDLHWAEAGLDILQQLSRLAPRLPLLIIGSYRTDEQTTLTEQLSLLNDLPLSRLSPPEIAELSTSMLGDVGERGEVLKLLQRETEGNAFFLVEVVRALAEEAGRLSAIRQMQLPKQLFPQGIQTIIQRRLARIPQDAVPLLVGTAVAGRQLDLSLLPLLAGITNTEVSVETWLAICADAAVLELFNGNWRFAHDKLRAGILETIEQAERVQWHQTIAELIEQVHPDDPEQAAALAHHWHEAGNTTKELAYARQAGSYAQQQFLNEAALHYLDRALELTVEEDLLSQFELHLAREQIYHLLGQREAQQATLTVLSNIAIQLVEQQNVEKRAKVALRLAIYAEATGDYPTAISAARQALLVAQTVGDRQSEAASHLASARALFRQSKYEEAQINFQKSLAAARTYGFIKLEADTVRFLGVFAYDTGQLDSAMNFYTEALSLYDTLKNKQGESAVHNNMSLVAMSQGNIEQALISLEKAREIDEGIGDREGRARVLSNLSSLYMDLGDFKTSEAYSKAALELCREIDVPLGECFTLINLSLSSHFLGDDEKAEAFSQEAIALSNKIGNQFLQGLAHKDRAFLLINQQKLGEAESAYHTSLDCLAQTEQILESQVGLAWLAHLREDETAVKQYIAPIVHHLKEDQNLDGTSRPFYALLLTYKVLAWLNDPYALTVLEIAYGRLAAWANQITDDQRRDSFLQDVPFNQEITVLYEAQN